MNKHLITVSVAALLATAGVAIAQTTKSDTGPPAQSAPAQSAPSDKGAQAPSKDGQAPGAQSGQTSPKSGDAQQQKAGETTKDKAGDKQQKAGDTAKDKAADKQQKAGDTAKDKAADKQQKAGDTAKDKAADKQQKAGDTAKDKAADKQQKAGDTAKDKAADKQQKAGDTTTKGTTAGSGASQSGGGEVRQGSQTNVTINVTQEQKTRARTVFSSRRSGAVVANINITPRIGIAVPRTVTLVAIPEEVYVIVPEYRRYRYFIVDDQVVIVDPDTFVIIDVILLA